MTVRTPTFLKGQFENGDIPSQTDYQDVFDSFLPIGASGSYTSLDINLGISGTVSANKIYTNYEYLDSNMTIVAQSTTQASAVTLSNSLSWIVSANGNNTAVKLPTSDPTRRQVIVNAASTVLKVFPPSGGNFVGTAANASLNLPVDKGATIVHGPSNVFIMIIGA